MQFKLFPVKFILPMHCYYVFYHINDDVALCRRADDEVELCGGAALSLHLSVQCFIDLDEPNT